MRSLTDLCSLEYVKKDSSFNWLKMSLPSRMIWLLAYLPVGILFRRSHQNMSQASDIVQVRIILRMSSFLFILITSLALMFIYIWMWKNYCRVNPSICTKKYRKLHHVISIFYNKELPNSNTFPGYKLHNMSRTYE